MQLHGQTREIQIAKAKALHGAAKEFAIENKMLGWQSFFQAVKVHKLSLFSKAALRAIKRLIIYKMKKFLKQRLTVRHPKTKPIIVAGAGDYGR